MNPSPVLSKGEFRNLPHLRVTANLSSVTFNQVYDVTNAYDAVIDRIVEAEKELREIRELAAAACESPPDEKVSKFGMIAAGFLNPWMGKHFEAMARLARRLGI